MNDLPVNIVESITKYLKLDEYKCLQLCSKDMMNTINKIFENEYNDIDDVCSLDINQLYLLFKHHSEYLSKHIGHCEVSVSYDLEWCKERYHNERMKRVGGLTAEQKAVISCQVQPGDVVLIQAFAGTGKTTTLLNTARQYSDKRILFITFNKGLSESTKKNTNSENIEICTMHSLALGYIDPNGSMEIGKISLRFLQKILNIERQDASIVRSILNNYFSSSSKSISSTHVNSLNLYNEQFFIDNAQYVWDLMILNKCKVPHDAYLKMFQLKNVKLEFDIIMLDEAQDSTECMLSILKKQLHTVRYLVGDIHQQIYGFRNVCNPFQEHRSESCRIKHFTLSQSFRYGYQIAHLSNMFLEHFKNEKKKINTVGMSTHICTTLPNEKYTLISRTNATLLREAFTVSQNRTCHLLGKSYNFEKERLYVQNIENIQLGNQTMNVEKLSGFNSINELKQHFRDLNNYKWAMRIALAEEYGTDQLIENYMRLESQIVDIEIADVILSTVHQAKGLEFNNVKLSNDFIPLVTAQNTIFIYKSLSALEGYNLLYVAMTRAKNNLIINKELYNFLKLKKGQRNYVSIENCQLCGGPIQSKKYEEGINCLGFDSKMLYSTITDTCRCI